MSPSGNQCDTIMQTSLSESLTATAKKIPKVQELQRRPPDREREVGSDSSSTDVVRERRRERRERRERKNRVMKGGKKVGTVAVGGGIIRKSRSTKGPNNLFAIIPSAQSPPSHALSAAHALSTIATAEVTAKARVPVALPSNTEMTEMTQIQDLNKNKLSPSSVVSGVGYEYSFER